MELLTTKVPRSLETKTKLFGYELGDLLLIFLYLSLSNLLFGASQFKFLVVWAGTISLAAGLRIVKRGRPERFLEHYAEYLGTPDVLSAGAPDTEYRPYPHRASR